MGNFVFPAANPLRMNAKKVGSLFAAFGFATTANTITVKKGINTKGKINKPRPLIQAGEFLQSKDTKMQITRENLDYDHANMRRHPGEGRFFFDAWIQDGEYQEDHKVLVVDFLEYCKETGLIHQDAHISHTKSYISIPVEIPAFDAGRDEYFSGYGKPRESTFEEFFSNWSCAGLTEAIIQFLNDSRICAG